MKKSGRKDLGQLYREAFLGFKEQFRRTTKDVSRIQFASRLPAWLYTDPQSLNAVVTAGLLAMLDHRAKDSKISAIALPDVELYTRRIMPEAMPKAAHQLDDIILQQVAITGMGLINASDLVKGRARDWERGDYPKYKRLLRALDKAAKIHQGKTRAPLDDPFLREAKEQAVKELRAVLNRLQKKFKAERQPERSTEAAILKAFEEEANKPELEFLSDSHNLTRWIEFLRTDPFSVLTSSAAELFDCFAAFVSGHKPDYTRRKYSSNR
jgi:hypothetical protein